MNPVPEARQAHRPFDRVTLRPGQSTRVSVTVDPRAAGHPLSYRDAARDRWVTPAGTFRVQVGASSRNLPLHAQFRLR